MKTPLDITRTGTNAYRLAKFLSDRRRKRPATRKEVLDRLGFDPAPYVNMYFCFKSPQRGQYIYTGNFINNERQEKVNA